MTLRRADVLAQLCENCNWPRASHSGVTKQGMCPGSKFGQGLKFKPIGGVFAAGNAFVLPGGGPWRILEECEARRHNTVRAAKPRQGPGCICPRALEVRKEYDTQHEKKRREQRRVAREKASKAKRAIRIGAAQEPKIAAPDWSRAACAGQALMADGVHDRQSASVATANMKRICATCPIRETLCLPYITQAEVPAGSWGGVWAGMGPQERAQAAR